MVLYFESDLGCGVREAADISIGRRAILDEVHADGGTVTLIREATEDDMSWVRPRGGCVDIDNQVSSEGLTALRAAIAGAKDYLG